MKYGPDLEITFTAPPPIVISLRGKSLQAYQNWLTTPTGLNLKRLKDTIYEQCEHHVLNTAYVQDWENLG